jgi:hypothetical protein
VGINKFDIIVYEFQQFKSTTIFFTQKDELQRVGRDGHRLLGACQENGKQPIASPQAHQGCVEVDPLRRIGGKYQIICCEVFIQERIRIIYFNFVWSNFQFPPAHNTTFINRS